MNLIDRDKLIQYLREYKINDILISTDELEIKGFNDGIDLTISVISDFPLQEKTSKVKIDYHSYRTSGNCCNCGRKVYDGNPYCSHCGAKLEWE